MFEKIKQTAALLRLQEEMLYEQVVQEIKRGQKREGLWAKAWADSGADDEMAKALYIKYRVQSIKDEAELASLAAGKEEARVDFAAQKAQQAYRKKLDEFLARTKTRVKANDELELVSKVVAKWRHLLGNELATYVKHQAAIQKEMVNDVDDVLRRMTFIEEGQPDIYLGGVAEACKKLKAMQFGANPVDILDGLAALWETLRQRLQSAP